MVFVEGIYFIMQGARANFRKFSKYCQGFVYGVTYLDPKYGDETRILSASRFCAILKGWITNKIYRSLKMEVGRNRSCTSKGAVNLSHWADRQANGLLAHTRSNIIDWLAL